VLVDMPVYVGCFLAAFDTSAATQTSTLTPAAAVTACLNVSNVQVKE
jgi:hypothetical protein